MIHVSLNSPEAGPVRALHGVNLGPIDKFYEFDHSDHFRRLRIPSVRTHDCNRSAADVVDLHHIFPNPKADPDDPASYEFALTDGYLRYIIEAGAQIYFRLGESIETRRTPLRKFVVGGRWQPETLAKVCLNIARHYNEGWANGHQWEIIHWQFWNEPSNCWVLPAEERPCWTGSTEEFYTLYGAVSRAFKAHNPAWKIGLAGYGRPDFIFPEGHPLFRPDNPWRHIEDIIKAGPIDSISWHQYGESWENLATSARQVREVLDANGLSHAENHITEWYYMPKIQDEKGIYTWFNARFDRDQERLLKVTTVMHGEEGAAYIFGSLARLQSEPIDLTHLYTGICNNALGLFDTFGRPYPCLTGMEVFSRFVGKPRLATSGGEHDRVTSLAIFEDNDLLVGIAHLRPSDNSAEVHFDSPVDLHWSAEQFGPCGWQNIATAARREGGGVVVQLPLQSSGITLLRGVPQSAA